MSLQMDWKLAWAPQQRDLFPVDVDLATSEQLLRVPGIGTKLVVRILRARRYRRLRTDDVGRRLPLAKVLAFVVTPEHRPRGLDASSFVATLPRKGELFA